MYQITTLDLHDNSWRKIHFNGYDAIFHVAGIAHIKETEKNRNLFYSVNRDLTAEVAEKAKNDGVIQFIYLSSMSVYGIDEGKIDVNTVPKPTTAYGNSKYQAEMKLHNLADEGFSVAILRPPMVYGKDCKGNFQTLLKFIRILPVFPKHKNIRSMIYSDNLCIFVKMVIDKKLQGLFFPQNGDYICTSNMVEQICKQTGKRMLFLSIFSNIIKKSRLSLIKKVFSDLYYDKSMSIPIENEVDFATSIMASVEGNRIT